MPTLDEAEQRWNNANKVCRDAVDTANATIIRTSSMRVITLRDLYKVESLRSAEAFKAFTDADAQWTKAKARADGACEYYEAADAHWAEAADTFHKAFERWKDAILLSEDVSKRSEETLARCDEEDAHCDEQEIRCAEAKVTWEKATKIRIDALLGVNKALAHREHALKQKEEADKRAVVTFQHLMAAQEAHNKLVENLQASIRTSLSIAVMQYEAECLTADDMDY
jgi:hypothetical protein